ncbi:MAG: NnrU family protein [Gammaproteobacteria bacterium]
MIFLIAGLLLWCAVHFFPALAVQARANLISRQGQPRYRSVFAVLIISSIVLMVLGWRSVDPAQVYPPLAWGKGASYVLVFFTFILFVAAKRQTNIKRVLRHPQLCGVILWSSGHLLANGDDRSLILFAGIGTWALLEIVLINRRVGAWIKPDPVPVQKDVITVVIGVILYLLLLLLHPYLSGKTLV